MGLLSSIGSFLFGGSKKKSESKATGTTDIDPYAPVIPYINQYIADTDSLYRTSPMFSSMEQQGYDLLGKVAGEGPSNYFNTAEKELTKTAQGDYLTPDTNPYLADIAKRISGIAGSNVNATFGGRGRSSGGLAGTYAGKAVGDSLTDMYGSVYESERGRQQAAAGMAPQFERARYDAPQALISAGQNITARPFDLNQQYGGILANIGRLGQQGTTTGTQTNYQQSPGLFGTIVNSLTNKLFPGGGSGPW